VAQANSTKAKALLDQAIQALGGEAYLNIQDVSQQAAPTSFHHARPPARVFCSGDSSNFPDKERIEVTKQRDIAYVYTATAGTRLPIKGRPAEETKVLTDYLRRREHSLEWVLRRWLKETGSRPVLRRRRRGG